jgi:hypothetical protein
MRRCGRSSLRSRRSCRRLIPGPDYLEALCEDNVNFINTKIRRFAEEGIKTVDGTERKVDLIV